MKKDPGGAGGQGGGKGVLVSIIAEVLLQALAVRARAATVLSWPVGECGTRQTGGFLSRRILTKVKPARCPRQREYRGRQVLQTSPSSRKFVPEALEAL